MPDNNEKITTEGVKRRDRWFLVTTLAFTMFHEFKPTAMLQVPRGHPSSHQSVVESTENPTLSRIVAPNGKLFYRQLLVPNTAETEKLASAVQEALEAT